MDAFIIRSCSRSPASRSRTTKITDPATVKSCEGEGRPTEDTEVDEGEGPSAATSSTSSNNIDVRFVNDRGGCTEIGLAIEDKDTICPFPPPTSPCGSQVSMASPSSAKRKTYAKSYNYSVHARHSQYSETTHFSGGKLFCTPCNIVLDHSRNSSITKYNASTKHKASVLKTKEEPALKRQRTITETVPPGSSTPSSIAHNDVCKDLVSAFAGCNIPFAKLDQPTMRQFLQKHVINGGSVPKARQLKQCYLGRKMDDHKSKVLEIMKDKPVSIICDEMLDDIGRFVLNILAAPLEPADADNRVKSYLLDTVFLEKTNHSTVSGAVVECLMRCGIDFQNIITFNSDNAQYMKKAYKDVLKGLMTNSVHVTCMAHVMALLGDAFRKPFERTHKYVKAANAMFWNAGARKGRYIRFLRDRSAIPKMPPNPIGTRWNCWFDAVRYHKTHLRLLQAFIWEEIEHCQNSAPESVLYLAEVFKDKDHVDCLEAEFSFISKKCQEFVSATDYFQSQLPLAMKVWSNMEDLQHMFGSCGVSLTDAARYFPENMTQSSKMSLQSLFCQAFSAVADKLDKYMTVEGQPGIEFLKQVPFFDPLKLVVFESGLNALPGLKDVPSDEIKKYKEVLGPKAVRVAGGLPIDLTVFWNSCASDVPSLAKCAKKYIYACVSSADAERSFSLYNLVFSERRRSMSDETLKSLLFLYYNNFIEQDVLNCVE